MMSRHQVSWIRRQDYKLLTVGQENLSSDERFVSEFGRHLGHAALRIKSNDVYLLISPRDVNAKD